MEEGESYDYILYLDTKTWEFMDGYTCQISDKYKKLMKKHKIEKIIFSYDYNEVPEIPNFIKKIKFVNNFNSCVDNLPKNIEEIKFGDEFNQPVDKLPKSLLVLEFGNNFNQSVDSLPGNLRELYFNRKMNCKFDKSLDKLPNNLKILGISSSFNNTLDNLPDSLEELLLEPKYCRSIFSQEIKRLPRNLKKIIYPRNYPYKEQIEKMLEEKK